MQDSSQDPEEEEDSNDAEMLSRAVAILQKVIQGVKISEKCKCAACEAGKFLNEII